ncbi:hypothetical protein F4780DRAFT_528056 [Xylariomycetidae sp. FL0641]|nr:hypothetical protein F4780DRAFT_528056 [Xylariomycetidae sp. FL0641]
MSPAMSLFCLDQAIGSLLPHHALPASRAVRLPTRPFSDVAWTVRAGCESCTRSRAGAADGISPAYSFPHNTTHPPYLQAIAYLSIHAILARDGQLASRKVPSGDQQWRTQIVCNRLADALELAWLAPLPPPPPPPPVPPRNCQLPTSTHDMRAETSNICLLHDLCRLPRLLPARLGI